MFHHFHGAGHPRAQGSIGSGDLNRLIERLGPERILAPDEWLERAESGRLRPSDVCLTFDDNLRCQFDVALPVLESRGIRAFWFVYTSPLEGRRERMEVYRAFRNTFESIAGFYAAFKEALTERERSALAAFDPRAYLSEFPFYDDGDREFRFLRDDVLEPERYSAVMESLLARHRFDEESVARTLWMDEACLRRLAGAGHAVGLHSHTHPTRLRALTRDQQYDEYFRNVSALRRVLGTRPTVMAHPNNSYDATTIGILESLGVQLGFRADMQDLPAASRFEFPREDQANLGKGEAA
jgi:peptidoglycan/xylan/chitin deacetylase (PgdA/CDA1 family)